MQVLKYLFSIFLYLLLFFSLEITYGQNQKKIDSLISLLSKKTNSEVEIHSQLFELYLRQNLDSAEIYKNKILSAPRVNDKKKANRLLLAAKYQFYRYNLDSALYFTKKAHNLAFKLEDNFLLADSHFKLGVLHSLLGNSIKEEDHRIKAYNKAKLTSDWKLISKTLIGLANQYYLRDNYPKAIQFYQSVDSIYASNKSEGEELAMTYENLSNIYINTHDIEAITYADKALQLYKKLDNKVGLGRNLYLKGKFYMDVEKDYNTAIEYLKKGRRFFQNYGNFRELAITESYLINSFSANKDYENARLVLQAAEIRLDSTENNIEDRYTIYAIGGQFYADSKNYRKSIQYFEKTLKLVEENTVLLDDDKSRNIYDVLGDIYTITGKYKKANAIRKKQIELTDSLNLKRNFILTKELETKYQTEKKEQEIKLLQAHNEAVEAQKKNERNMLLGGLGVTTVTGIFLFFLFRNRQRINKKLRELDSAKSNFFANISHELRTPLTLISTPIQERLSQNNLPEKERKEYELILRNNNQLTNLVDQLLDLSKLESGSLKLKVSQIKIESFLKMLIEPYAYQARVNEIKFNLTLDIQKDEIWTDYEALQKIVSNLLSNALKYTLKGGNVNCLIISNPKTLDIIIKNTGKPLSEYQKKQIFNRFYQIDEYKQGTGIGLALVKELIDLYKGKITVENVNNTFIQFKVILPTLKSNFKTEEIYNNNITIDIKNNESVKSNTASKLTLEQNIESTNKLFPLVLLVEDSEDLRIILKETLKKDYRIIIAKNGEEGVKIAINQIPDLIISDIMMPIKDGITLTQELKQNELTSHIPIILLTAKVGDKNELLGINSGADDYITKPFNNTILQSKMVNLIAIRKKMRERYSQEIILKPKDIAITPTDEVFLERIQIVIDEFLTNPTFTADIFAKKIGFSRMQLHRKLKALTGLSTTEFIRLQRLKMAQQLLKESDKNISDVCYNTGFNNLSYFTKCFKETYGVTPSAYAKKV